MSMKKLMIASAAALAMGSVTFAHAASTILFDRDGAGGTGAIAVDVFDWTPGNALAVGSLSTPPVGGISNFQVVSQGSLGLFIGPSSNSTPLGSSEFTFQASFWEAATGIGTSAASFSLGVGASTFSVYYEAIGNANNVTGAGYGDGTLILSGTIVGLTGGFVDADVQAGNLCATAGTCGLLDQLGADNQNGTKTHTGNGSTTVQVDVSFAHADFFKSSITSLLIDLQDTTNNATPFSQTNPSNAVVGITPFYSLMADGSRVNGAACTLGGNDENGNFAARCDNHLQTDASTSFNPVPEPGSLAIVGLALGALGLVRRRRTS